MAQPIYLVWMSKYTPEWYKLSKDEQDALMAKVGEARNATGGEEVLTRISLWCSENWLAWGVEKYPDIEAVQKHSLLLYNLNWYQFVEASSYLGVEMPQA
jgi:hypothetical protein